MDGHILEDLDIEGTQAPMILLLGQTGAGKSHFINSLKPGSVKESAHSVSCKQTKLHAIQASNGTLS